MGSGARGQVAPSHPRDERLRARPEKPVAFIEPSMCGCERSPNCPVSRICPKNAVVPLEGHGPEPERRRGLRHLLSSSRPTGWRVDGSKCSGCLLCAPYCPQRAVQARLREAS